MAKCATAVAAKSKTQNQIHPTHQQPMPTTITGLTADGGWFHRSGIDRDDVWFMVQREKLKVTKIKKETFTQFYSIMQICMIS